MFRMHLPAALCTPCCRQAGQHGHGGRRRANRGQRAATQGHDCARPECWPLTAAVVTHSSVTDQARLWPGQQHAAWPFQPTLVHCAEGASNLPEMPGKKQAVRLNGTKQIKSARMSENKKAAWGVRTHALLAWVGSGLPQPACWLNFGKKATWECRTQQMLCSGGRWVQRRLEGCKAKKMGKPAGMKRMGQAWKGRWKKIEKRAKIDRRRWVGGDRRKLRHWLRSIPWRAAALGAPQRWRQPIVSGVLQRLALQKR